jgi:hypothetical protein
VSITLAAFAFAEPLGVNPSISIVDHGTPCRRKLSNQPTNQPTNQPNNRSVLDCRAAFKLPISFV